MRPGLTKVDVLQSVGPLVTHQLEHLEQLLVVQILLSGDDVDHLVKLVLFPSLSRTTEITGDVDRSPVGLSDDDLAELVLFQVTQVGTLVLDQEVLFLHDLVRLVHLLSLDGGFTRVRVEVDVQTLVGLFETLDGKVTESGPETEGGFVACKSPGHAGSAWPWGVWKAWCRVD